ncbi:RNase H family protein [Gordonia phthalatica]|nr:RNase H family protein [Gordonia phthalatica]
MSPIPVARPLAPGIILPRRLPRHTVHLAVSRSQFGRCRYLATSTLGRWSAIVATDHPRVALLDAVQAVRSAIPDGHIARVAVRLAGPAMTRPLLTDFEACFPQMLIERETAADGAALDRIQADLDARMRADAACVPPLVVATDGSVVKKATGSGWLTELGDHGLRTYPARPYWNHGYRVIAAELRAVASAMDAIPHRRLQFLIDSRPAITALLRWQRSGPSALSTFDNAVDDSRTLSRLRTRVGDERERLDFTWVPGHGGVPLNEGADSLAKLARLRMQGVVPVDEYPTRAAAIATAFADQHRAGTHESVAA